MIGIDLLVRNDGNFTWGFLTPLNVQLAPSLWDSFGSGGGGPFFFKTREGNIGVMGVSGDVNNYRIKFKMLNPACLGSPGTILRAVQADPRETAAQFLVGGLSRHAELDVGSFAQRPDLITKVKSNGVPFGPRRLDIVYANSGVALAVTSKFGGDDYRRFVLRLSKEADRWLVTDVQIEPKSQDGEALRNFLKECPDARIAAKDLRGQKLISTVPEAVGSKTDATVEANKPRSSSLRSRVTDVRLPFTFTIYTLTPDNKPQPGVKVRCLHPRPERAEPVVDMVVESDENGAAKFTITQADLLTDWMYWFSLDDEDYVGAPGVGITPDEGDWTF
ncbi:MAG: hypothetical protein JSV16_12280, partial [Candidatus Hydrogenedentota bacterium]